MNRLAVGEIAPDFALPDHQGAMYRLSELTPTQKVLLVFNIGFI